MVRVFFYIARAYHIDSWEVGSWEVGIWKLGRAAEVKIGS